MRSGGIRKQTERVATVTPTVAGEVRESATPPFLIYLVMCRFYSEIKKYEINIKRNRF